MASKIQEIKAKRDELLARAREIENTAPADERRALSELIEQLQRDLIAAITEGAEPCPKCGRPPVGIEQPRGKGLFEYEIGCRTCKPFEHTDGTVRKCSVRGGLLPKHAVEAWNAGPDHWTVIPVEELLPMGRASKKKEQ